MKRQPLVRTIFSEIFKGSSEGVILVSSSIFWFETRIIGEVCSNSSFLTIVSKFGAFLTRWSFIVPSLCKDNLQKAASDRLYFPIFEVCISFSTNTIHITFAELGEKQTTPFQ